jgi:two-component system response regulator MprA
MHDTSTAVPISVLVVDDDTEIRSMLRRVLLAEGWNVDTARTARDGLDLARQRVPDVIVFDIGLPDVDGIEAVRALRSDGMWIPVLMLTARGELGSRVESFEAGADDFLAKPFANEELVLRIRALARRAHRPADSAGAQRIRHGDLVIDSNAPQCWRGEREVALAPREFDLLDYLARNDGVTLSRHQIADAIWQGAITDDANAVDVYVGYLRRKLESDGEARVIHTVRGHGYRFAAGGTV